MEPYYDILGIEQTATPAEVEAAYTRLSVFYDRNDKLDSAEYADIEMAYNTILTQKPQYPEDFIIDRSIWVWNTCQDKTGQWNTLVKKAHIQAERKAVEWDSEQGKAGKRKKEADRKKGQRDRRGGHDED
jgi:hypothetical protein